MNNAHQIPMDMTSLDLEAEEVILNSPQRRVPRILVADDEPEVVTALTMRLKSAGYEVISASDGASAMRATVNYQPDLIILDIGMPCGDGHAVAFVLSDHTDHALIPVIYLTARRSQKDKERAMSMGASDYITKPYTAERLLSAVEHALKPNLQMRD